METDAASIDNAPKTAVDEEPATVAAEEEDRPTELEPGPVSPAPAADSTSDAAAPAATDAQPPPIPINPVAMEKMQLELATLRQAIAGEPWRMVRELMQKVSALEDDLRVVVEEKCALAKRNEELLARVEVWAEVQTGGVVLERTAFLALESSRADLLRQLESRDGEVRRLSSELAAMHQDHQAAQEQLAATLAMQVTESQRSQTPPPLEELASAAEEQAAKLQQRIAAMDEDFTLAAERERVASEAVAAAEARSSTLRAEVTELQALLSSSDNGGDCANSALAEALMTERKARAELEEEKLWLEKRVNLLADSLHAHADNLKLPLASSGQQTSTSSVPFSVITRVPSDAGPDGGAARPVDSGGPGCAPVAPPSPTSGAAAQRWQ